jgi:tRNA(Arg) A34 adenosine deaminase TadA
VSPIRSDSLPPSSEPPSLDPNDPVVRLWHEPLARVATPEPVTLTEAEKERHRICCLVLISLILGYWNGNKRGRKGEYPWREGQRDSVGGYVGGDYLGHNIGCLAVDGVGRMIDFDFNHNEIFNSSVEHAEARLVKRVFTLSRVYQGWATTRPADATRALYSRLVEQTNAPIDLIKDGLDIAVTSLPPSSVDYMSTLSDVTIYTSLESCAQCSGIMALAKVKAVVYLQKDRGMYSIGNIMRNLTTESLRAPLPISADLIDLPQYNDLDVKFKEFYRGVGTGPFWVLNDRRDTTPSVTSFLCTDSARETFATGADELGALVLHYPEAAPFTGALTNAEVLESGRKFLSYSLLCGERGTAHK